MPPGWPNGWRAGWSRGSFAPDRRTPETRNLSRAREQLGERGGHVQRLPKTLQDANIKLDPVIADIVSLSGLA